MRTSKTVPEMEKCNILRSYQKCAEMMLEMKQSHDASSNFLEAAVRAPQLYIRVLLACDSQHVLLVCDSQQLCFKKCNIGSTVKCYEAACSIQVCGSSIRPACHVLKSRCAD